MRIAYVSFEPPTDKTGIAKKLRAQTTQWRNHGHDVHHISLRAPASLIDPTDVIFPIRKTIISPLVSATLNWGSVRQHLQSLDPDIVYIREFMWWPGMYRTLRGFKIVEEVNSDSRQELRTTRLGAIKQALNFLGSGGHAKHITDRVYVTHELRDRLARDGERSCVIGNGADFGAQPPEKSKASKVQIVMVSSANHPWQGVDILRDMARRNSDYDFHLVGPIALSNVPENLHLHGQLNAAELSSLYRSVDVGLSTLTLYRKGMREACPLKIREYSEYGIPVAAGCSDTDLDGADYFLDLSPFRADQGEWDRRFRRFVEKWRNTPYPYEDARKRLSNEIKERKRIQFFQQAIGI